jgi:hypothetical protein
MNKSKSLLRFLFFFIAVSIVGSCGGSSGRDGGGSGGGTALPQTTLTANNSSAAASAAIKTVNLVGPLSALGGIQIMGTSSEAHSGKLLTYIIEKAISLSKTASSESALISQGILPPLTKNCQDGGTVTASAIWDGPFVPDDLSEVVDLEGTMDFDSCRDGTNVFNGEMDVSFNGPLSAPNIIDIFLRSFSYTDAEDGDSIVLTNFSIIGTNLIFTGDDLTAATLTVTGTLSGIADNETINAEFSSFIITYSTSASGVTITVSGMMYASCLGGWVTISTTTAIFIPTSADCPTSGEVVITASGDTTRLVVQQDSQITVLFNDTVVDTYNDCEELESICI